MTSSPKETTKTGNGVESLPRLAALLETSHEITGKLELGELLEAVALRAQDLVRCDGVTLYLIEDEILRPIVCYEEYAEEVLSTPLKLGEGVSGSVAVTGEAEMVNRVDLTGRGFLIPGTPLDPESLLCAPLKYKDEVIGVLTLNRLGEWEFTSADLEFTKGLASLAAAAIHSARLYERLADSERNYRTLFNSIGEAVFVHDPETKRLLDASDSAVRRYGYTRDEILNMTILDLHPEEEQESRELHVPANIQDGVTHYRGIHHRKKDGTLIDVTISAVDIELRGRPARLALAVDVTEWHRIFRELEQARKLESVGLLASGIAHNLNGPLAGIQGFAELLRATHPGLVELDLILKQVYKINEIVRTLMLKARNQQEQKSRNIQINALLRTELSFLEANLFFKHEVEKSYEFDPMLPEVRAVYGDLSQALLNIINNAIDAMRDSPRRLLQVRTRHADGQIIIEIEDSGIGMSEEVMSRIFEPFFTTKPPPDGEQFQGPTGTGLGLSASGQFLARYKGKIEVRSRVNQGSVFTIILPSAKQAEAEQPPGEEFTVA